MKHSRPINFPLKRIFKNKSIIIIVIAYLIYFEHSNAQTVIWSESFSNGCASACPGESYVGLNGSWDQLIVGIEGANPNRFFVSCAESNTGVGNCSSGCSLSSNPTLHISAALNNSICPNDCGASYDAGGFCGIAPPIGSCPQTNRRIQSPIINLSGYSNLTLNFLYLEGADGSLDNATVWYFDGSAWNILSDPPSTLNSTCNGQGKWTAYSVSLPISANNNPSVRIGFRWENNDDGIGSDPSFAVDDISITTQSNNPPIASFLASATNICIGDCIDFTFNGSALNGAIYNWNFGNGQSSNSMNPTSICYNNPGNYSITLTVNDANGNDVETINNYITVNGSPSAGLDNSSSLCNNSSVNLSSLLVGATSGGTWSETTPIQSGQFNSNSAQFDATNLLPGNYTFSYAVSGVNSCPGDDATITVSVTTCPGPIASIVPSSNSVCEGQLVIFNSNSVGNAINSYQWTFNGGTPSSATGPGPIAVVFNSVGIFSVELVVTDVTGTDDQIIAMNVEPCNTPSVMFTTPYSNICTGDCILFENASSSDGPTSYVWSFEGGNPPTSGDFNPQEICFDTPGTYTISLFASNDLGSDTYAMDINVTDIPAFNAYGDTTIDMGGIAQLSADQNIGTINWSWNPNNQGDIIFCELPDCSSVSVNPLTTTTFVATASITYFCEVTDTVLVIVDFKAHIGVPNSFSPDNNGTNDILYVRGDGIEKMIFRIYNRYGQLVFESENQSNGWDGTFNTLDEKPGTFTYTLDYSLVDGSKGKLNGNVTLFR